ncbi:histidine phosphatase super family protein, partial [Vibrio parahaemolyticus EKP-028]
KTADERRAL